MPHKDPNNLIELLKDSAAFQGLIMSMIIATVRSIYFGERKIIKIGMEALLCGFLSLCGAGLIDIFEALFLDEQLPETVLIALSGMIGFIGVATLSELLTRFLNKKVEGGNDNKDEFYRDDENNQERYFMALPRGIRNNNAGNIRWGCNWQGLLPEAERTDKSFCQFKTPVYGIRAIVKLVFTYRDKYGLNTIESIINRYAPPNENNTQGYINRVCEKLGVKPNEPIKLTDDVLLALVRAICAVENGNLYYNYYSDDLIKRAIESARA